ncbi:MAG: hypothetical protein ACTILD_09245, partial [Pseudoalteromonas sp.]
MYLEQHAFFKFMDEHVASLLFYLDNYPAVMEYLSRDQVSSMKIIEEGFMPLCRLICNEQK